MIPVCDFMNLVAYEQINPCGETRDDLRTALTCLTINRAMGGKAEINDFVLNFNERDLDVSKSQDDFDLKLKYLGKSLKRVRG